MRKKASSGWPFIGRREAVGAVGRRQQEAVGAGHGMGDRARVARGEGRWQGEVEAAKAVEAPGCDAVAR